MTVLLLKTVLKLEDREEREKKKPLPAPNKFPMEPQAEEEHEEPS